MAYRRYAIMTDMQPENINLPKVPEATPNIPAPSMDHLPTLPNPETGLNTGAERHEQAGELSAAQADAASAAVPVTMLAQPTVVDDTTSATPLTAANDDLIEKEWVDKAKEIIHTTPNDPHMRGEKVSALQKDYLRKRYGKEIGTAS
jgi:hypothetical protein